MATTVARRVAGGAVAWLLGIGAAAAVVHPESCPAPSRREATTAVSDAVRWLADNQRADGRFLYRYDRVRDRVEPGYVEARHAGTLLALAQAAAVDAPRSLETARRGIDWALAHTTDLRGDRLAFTGDTGATALLIAAMVEHRRLDGDERYDRELAALGRFVAGAVTPDGAVVATWDLGADRGVTGSRSPFFTGEVLLALVRLHATFPDGGWDDAARRVRDYVATRRDDEERRLPPVSDHWSAYALAELASWPGGGGLDAAALSYARRQAGIFGVQARYESQRRTRGIVRWTRGPLAVPSGIGTVGEGLGAVARLAEQAPALAVDRAAVRARLVCVAGLLVTRQSSGGGPRSDGAWFRGDDTQVDDQQHAISALLAALPELEDPR